MSPTDKKRAMIHDQSDNNKAKYNCCCFCSLVPVDQDFNFFPIAFLYYLVFLLLICIVILVYEFINYNEIHHSISMDLMYDFSIRSYHKHSISKLHEMNRSNTDSLISFTVHVFDFIIIYGFLILQQWHSFISFWRYYTTEFESTTTCSVLLTFSVFTTTSTLLFVTEIHIYYFLFPITLLLYFTFNWYYTWKFASMLIKHYKVFITMENECIIRSNIDNESILKSIYVMRRASLICNILNSLSLSIFLILYNIESVSILPIFWSISSAVFSFNFVRNRNFITRKLQPIGSNCCFYLPKTDSLHRCKNDYHKQFIFSMQSAVELSVGQNSQTSATQRAVAEPSSSNLKSVVVIGKEGKLMSKSCSNLRVRCKENGSNLKVSHSDEKADQSIRGIHNFSAPSLLKHSDSDVISHASASTSASRSAMNLKQNSKSINNEINIASTNSVGVIVTDSNGSNGLPNIFRVRSKSVEMGTNDMKEIDIEQVLRSFNVLYKYGFFGKSVSNLHAIQKPKVSK